MDPLVKRGSLSIGALQRTGEAARRLAMIRGGAGTVHRWGPAGPTIDVPGPTSFWAELLTSPFGTGGSGSGCGSGSGARGGACPEGYGWREVAADRCGGRFTPPDARSGTSCQKPAYEWHDLDVELTTNGLPTVVRLFYSESGDCYYFLAGGTGTGPGGGTQVDGLWIIRGIADASGADPPPPPDAAFDSHGRYCYVADILSTPDQTGGSTPPRTGQLVALYPFYQYRITGRILDEVELAPQPAFSGIDMEETVDLTFVPVDGMYPAEMSGMMTADGDRLVFVSYEGMVTADGDTLVTADGDSFASSSVGGAGAMTPVTKTFEVYYSWYSPGALTCDGVHPILYPGSS